MFVGTARGRVLAVAFACTLASCASAPPKAPAEEPHHHELHLPPVGPTVHVSLDDKSVEIALASIAHEGPTVALVDLWKAAWPSDDPSPLHFDLTGSDGFRPTTRPRCTRLLTGAEIAHARIDVVSHDVSFDDTLDLPGCYRVKAVVAIDATR